MAKKTHSQDGKILIGKGTIFADRPKVADARGWQVMTCQDDTDGRIWYCTNTLAVRADVGEPVGEAKPLGHGWTSAIPDMVRRDARAELFYVGSVIVNGTHLDVLCEKPFPDRWALIQHSFFAAVNARHDFTWYGSPPPYNTHEAGRGFSFGVHGMLFTGEGDALACHGLAAFIAGYVPDSLPPAFNYAMTRQCERLMFNEAARPALDAAPFFSTADIGKHLEAK